MATETVTSLSEVAILSRILDPGNGSLTVAAARSWLKLDFTDHDRARMHQLALLAQAGTPSPEDEADLESYRRLGRMLDMMHSKARHSLKKRGARV